jgi:hypothetical protein
MGKSRRHHSSESSDSDSHYRHRYSNSDKRKCSGKRKSSCSSSSSSDYSTDEKKIIHKVKNVAKHMERKDHELDRKDRHFERKIHRLEDKYRRIYKKIKYCLRREKCLMVNGCDAYGSFSNNVLQTLLPGDSITFGKNEGSLNMEFSGTEIQIYREGVYRYVFSGQFNEGCLLQLFNNGVPIDATIVGSNSGANIVTLQQLLFLHVGDVITVRNVHNTSIATATGFDTINQNVDFTLFRIAPLPEKCCLPPPIEECIVWTTDDCSSSSSSDHKPCGKPCDLPTPPPKQTEPKQETKTNQNQTQNNKSLFIVPKQAQVSRQNQPVQKPKRN